ncbi:hypothetical protein ISCGN_019573 [Ixodes scapularis]
MPKKGPLQRREPGELSRRCCSTPAMASLSDFPDSFIDEIKSKITVAEKEHELDCADAEEKEDQEPVESSKENSAVVFSLRNQVGALVRALRVFKTVELESDLKQNRRLAHLPPLLGHRQDRRRKIT